MKNYTFLLTLILMGLSFGTLSAQASSPTGVGLIGHYLFNGDSQDQSGNQNNGQNRGGVKYGKDRFGSPCGAAEFNGRSAYVEVPHSTSLNSPQRELTVSTWFKLTNGATDLKWLTVVCKSDSPLETPNSPHYRMQATKVTLSINTDFTENLNKDLSFNTWYHYAMVYDGSMVTAYLNGQQYFTFPYRGSLNGNTLPLNIGRDLPGNPEYFAGSLDDLRIYDRALSIREIRALYSDDSERTSPKPCSPPVVQPPIVTAPPTVTTSPPVTTPPPTSTPPAPPITTPQPPVVTPPPPAPVRPPVVTITDPTAFPKEVQQAQYRLLAQIDHVANKRDVSFTVNQQPVQRFDYDPNTGAFRANVQLNEGANYFSITGTNEHGRDNQMTVINYNKPAPTPPPIVTIITPAMNPAKVQDARQTLRASIQNVASKREIKVYFNGSSYPDFDYNPNTKIVTFDVTLKAGINSFQVVAENGNGRDAQSGYIELVLPPPPPVVTTPPPTTPTTPPPADAITVPGLPSDVQQAVGVITSNESIEVEYDRLRLVLYDHEQLDGDTVSVYLNDQLLVDRQLLKTDILDWIRIDLPRLTKGQTYYIISKAWNLGTIPPNTLTLELYDQNGMIRRVQLESEPGKSEALRIIYK